VSLLDFPRPTTAPDVALVHDYLNQRGGAERVVLALAEQFEHAPIYTSLYRPQSTFSEFEGRDIRTAWVDRLPVDARFRALLPLYPSAFAGLGTLEHDVVISSSSGWAHSVRVAPESRHIVYCHSPARWLYSGDDWFEGKRGCGVRTALLGPLRVWDRRAAHRPDVYLANAENVRDRIRATYGIEAEVVHPPVDTERFTPRPRGDRLLVVSRLMAYKRIDLVVQAATWLGIGLDVVGVGPELERLRQMAGPSVTFHGRLPDAEVTELMETCSALCFPGREDFGITPVEAMAAGKPVVAFAAGGALETLEDGVTAAHFHEQSVAEVARAIRRVQTLGTSPERIAREAERFSTAAFQARMAAIVAGAAAPVAQAA
jgi:glycosyltransferase involved in cell wall biosynthesis